MKWTAPYDGTFHIQATPMPHDFADCGRLCNGLRSGTMPWIAKGTVVDLDQMLAAANEQPPTRPTICPGCDGNGPNCHRCAADWADIEEEQS